jgi:hypothetical protein
MLHGTGPVLRTWLQRASTWQRALVAVALIAAGCLLAAFGDVRAAVVGLVGVLLLWGTVRNGVRRHRVPRAHHGDDRGPS